MLRVAKIVKIFIMVSLSDEIHLISFSSADFWSLNGRITRWTELNLLFKDQKSAYAVRKQLSDQPVFKSRKICEDLKMCEPNPPIISQQCVVYNYKCDLCDAEYVGYTSRHLHQRIVEHRYSAIGKHLKNDHGLETIGDLTKNFSLLKKCNGKLKCLIYEMLFIKKKRPCLNTQSDSIRAKLFI